MLQTTPPDQTAIARRPDTAGPLAVATPTTRKLADASITVNTRRAYLGALARLDAWRGTAPVDDASLAVYLGTIYEAGRAPATAALAVAAVRFRAKLAGQPDPAGAATARVLGGYRRTAADRGRGQAAPLRADGLAAILATAERPRTDDQPEVGETTAGEETPAEAPVKPVKLLPPDEDLAETYAASVMGLEEIDLQIEEIIEDKSAEYLADVQDFNAEYRGLVREWDTFHRDFNAWRESDGDCNRLAVLGVLNEYSQDAGALGRQVRDLPQSGFLLPIYTLLTEAAERNEAAMRTVYSSWRPFAVDVFKAVDEERVASDRLWRRAGIALQELRDRP